ncbi:MAG: phosphatase PAP2 family protein [Pseudonocardia sp.]
MAETAARIGPSDPPAVLPVPNAVLPVPTAVLPVPTAEVRALAAVQRAARGPAMVRVALGMSLFGEHAAGWLAIGTIGALTDRPRRRQWLTATLTVALAHGASVGVKRVVRRPRPDHPQVRVLAGTPSGLSFPSAHATSTTAAAIAFGALLHRPLVALLVPPMALSRLVLGVHYPSDVLAGSALGAAVVVAARRIGRKATR